MHMSPRRRPRNAGRCLVEHSQSDADIHRVEYTEDTEYTECGREQANCTELDGCVARLTDLDEMESWMSEGGRGGSMGSRSRAPDTKANPASSPPVMKKAPVSASTQSATTFMRIWRACRTQPCSGRQPVPVSHLSDKRSCNVAICPSSVHVQCHWADFLSS